MEIVEDWYIYTEYSNFLREVNFVHKEYKNRISKLYKTPDEEANEYTKYLYENPNEYSYIENIEDVEPEILRLSFERYLLVKNIKYRYLCINILTLYQMVEQFFSSIIKMRISISMDNELKEKYNNENFYLKDIKTFYEKDYNYEFGNNKEYQTLDELRLLENVIKHGEGKSANDLRKINDKYFKKIPSTYPYTDTIINDNLNIDDKDFERFCNAINNFINTMPKKFEHSYKRKK